VFGNAPISLKLITFVVAPEVVLYPDFIVTP